MAKTYSFISVSASIAGAFGSFTISSGNTEGGITVAMRGPKNTLTIGADGSGMNSLHADNSASVTVRLLKVSPVNSMLNAMYEAERQFPSTWGQNNITIRDINMGDVISLNGCAFSKRPDVTYDKEGPALEWVFDCANVTEVLGVGSTLGGILGTVTSIVNAL